YGDPDHAVAGQARASTAFAEFSRRLAASAVYAAVCAELAVCVARRGVFFAGTVPGVLALAWPARDHTANHAGRAYHDFWGDFYLARRTDSCHRGICK